MKCVTGSKFAASIKFQNLSTNHVSFEMLVKVMI